MKLKHLPVIFLLSVCILPTRANDIALDLDNLRQIRNDINSITYKNLVESGFTINKPNISTYEDARKLASDFVDRLYKAFSATSEELNVQEFENLVKALKIDILHLASIKKQNVDLLKIFIETYHERAMTYGAMQTPLDLFLDEITKGDGLIKTLELAHGDDQLIKKIASINTNGLEWDSFLQTNRKELLLDFMKTDRPILSKFTKMIESTLSQSVPQADRQIVSKIAILNDMIRISEKEYEMTRESARYGHEGARAELRADALQKYFGELKAEDAEFINEILEKTNPSSLERILPEAKGWVKGFSKWSERSLKPKRDIIFSIGAMVALVVIGELIKEYVPLSSNLYLTTLDEINDALEVGNYTDLVYRSVYDTKFAKVFDQVFEEELNEEEQSSYTKTLIVFNRAIFDTFFKETEEKINKQIYNCFTYGTDCA